MQNRKWKYLFGPVSSRRLGRSLGVDLLPYKTCTMDCIYCECGETTLLTMERAEFIKMEEVLTELREFLKEDPQVDFITFSGSGEPTLYLKLGDLIKAIHKEFKGLKVCVITNSSLLGNERVRSELCEADLVMPSLDAVTAESYKKINRPFSENPIQIVNSLIKFRAEYHGPIWLEIFLIKGLNDSNEEIRLFKECIAKIKPDRVQLNSLDRAPAVSSVLPYPDEDLILIQKAFLPIQAEIITRGKSDLGMIFDLSPSQLLETLKRTPLSILELEWVTGFKPAEIGRLLQKLINENEIEAKQKGDQVIYYKKGN